MKLVDLLDRELAPLASARITVTLDTESRSLSFDEARNFRARLHSQLEELRRLAGASPRAASTDIQRDDKGEIARLERHFEY